MNKADLVAAVAGKIDFSKRETERVLDAVVDTISEALGNGDKVQLAGFGTFEVKQRASRTCNNPRTGELMEIPAKTVPVFKAGSKLKNAVAG